jgi:hypothetical protein
MNMQSKEQNYPIPIPDSYWVRPGRLLAGEYPRTRVDQESRLKLRRFLETGIDLFLDLTEPGECDLKPYAALLQAEALALGRKVERQNISIPDMGIPTRERMQHILDTIDLALASDRLVYVHCWGGIGRTGTVVGCYLAQHGLSGPAALAEIARLRQGLPDAWQASPQTPAQTDMVLNWPVKGEALRYRHYLPGSYALILAESGLKSASYLVTESLWNFREG